jgi:hypothetical protein
MKKLKLKHKKVLPLKYRAGLNRGNRWTVVRVLKTLLYFLKVHKLAVISFAGVGLLTGSGRVLGTARSP